MAITPNFRPAQHIYQSTYQPLPFQEIASLGMYMQEKADKTRAATYEYEDRLQALPSTVGGADAAKVAELSNSYRNALEDLKSKSPMGSAEFDNAFRSIQKDAASKASAIMEMQKTKQLADKAYESLADRSLRPWEKESTARKLQQYEQFGTFTPEGNKVSFDLGKSNYLDVDLFEDAKQFFEDAEIDPKTGNIFSGVFMEDISDRYGIVKKGEGYTVNKIPDWVKDRFDTELTERAVSSLVRKGSTDPYNSEDLEREKLNIYKEEALKSTAEKITRANLVAGGKTTGVTEDVTSLYEGAFRTDLIDQVTRPVDATISQDEAAALLNIEKHSGDAATKTGTYGHKRFGDSDHLLIAAANPEDVKNSNVVTEFKAKRNTFNSIKDLKDAYDQAGVNYREASNALNYLPEPTSEGAVEAQGELVLTRNSLNSSMNNASSKEMSALNSMADILNVDKVKTLYEYESADAYQEAVDKVLKAVDEYNDSFEIEKTKMNDILKKNGFPEGVDDIDTFYEGLEDFTVWASENFQGDFNVNPGSGVNKKHITLDDGISRPAISIDLVMSDKELASKLEEWYNQLPEDKRKWWFINLGTIKAFRKANIDLLSGKYYTTGEEKGNLYSIPVWDAIDVDKVKLRELQKKRTGTLSGNDEIEQNRKLDEYIIRSIGNK